MDTMTEIFGEVISTYTRAQAFEDGQLIDLEGHESTNIYKHPVAFTAALWAEVERGAGSEVDTRNARIWDVCWMASRGQEMDRSSRRSKVIIGRQTHVIYAQCHPGDDAEPVITIGFPLDF